MAQKPKSRHSGATRKPVTIDLDASEVKSEETVPSAEPVAFEDDTAADPAPASEAQVTETEAPRTRTSRGSDAEARDAIEKGATAGVESETDRAETDAASTNKTTVTPARASNLAWLGGGVIGGLVALLLAGGLQWAGVVPSMRGAEPVDLSPLQSRIDALSAKVDDMQAAEPGAPADLTARVDTAASAASANGEAIAALQTDLSALDDRLTSLNETISSGGAGENAGLEALTARASSIEDTLSALSARVDTLSSGDSSAASDADDAFRGELDTVSQAASAVREAVDSLRSDVESLGGGVAENGSRLDAMGERLTAVESDIDSGAGSRVAAAIAASALKSAADRGAGFMSELEAYASVSQDDATVAALRDYAASGVPTVSQLVERFPPVANRIATAAQGLDRDAGILDRLSASARSLVQVRPVGEVEGDAPGAVAARMEVALKGGALDRVIAEWEKLPEAAQSASADFMADVKARSELDTLISRVLAGAMAAAEDADATPAGTGE